MSTVDSLVQQIMAERQRIVGKDRDPGDIDISFQDDMPMVIVKISKYEEEAINWANSFYPDAIANSAAEALSQCLEKLKLQEPIDWGNL